MTRWRWKQLLIPGPPLLMPLMIVAIFVACAGLKTVLHTADDAASILCELFAAEHKEQITLTPKQFCAIHENFAPFIDQVLAAKAAASETVGTRLGLGSQP